LKPPCRFFQVDACRYGESCRFAHVKATGDQKTSTAAAAKSDSLAKKPQGGVKPRKSSEPAAVFCRHWLAGEKCQYGDQCRFAHPGGLFGRDARRPVKFTPKYHKLAAAAAAPGRSRHTAWQYAGPPSELGKGSPVPPPPSDVICRYWKDGVPCRFGHECRFKHEGERIIKKRSAKPVAAARRRNNTMVTKKEEEEEAANSGGGILGFNANQVMDLLEKNVKPWDEAARELLKKKQQQQQQGEEEEEAAVGADVAINQEA